MKVYDKDTIKALRLAGESREPVYVLGSRFYVESWSVISPRMDLTYAEFELVESPVRKKEVSVVLEINHLYKQVSSNMSFGNFEAESLGVMSADLEINFLTEDSRGIRKVIHTDARNGKVGFPGRDANFKIPFKFLIPEDCSITYEVVRKTGTAKFKVWYE